MKYTGTWFTIGSIWHPDRQILSYFRWYWLDIDPISNRCPIGINLRVFDIWSIIWLHPRWYMRTGRGWVSRQPLSRDSHMSESPGDPVPVYLCSKLHRPALWDVSGQALWQQSVWAQWLMYQWGCRLYVWLPGRVYWSKLRDWDRWMCKQSVRKQPELSRFNGWLCLYLRGGMGRSQLWRQHWWLRRQHMPVWVDVCGLLGSIRLCLPYRYMDKILVMKYMTLTQQ